MGYYSSQSTMSSSFTTFLKSSAGFSTAEKCWSCFTAVEMLRNLIPFFIEEGIDCLQPLEVKAGMNLVELKESYGDKLCFMGGIDVRLMVLDDLHH